MAIAVSNLTSGQASAVSSPSTASVTPASNALALVAVHAFHSGGASAAPTVTGNSLTWIQVATLIWASNWRTTLYRDLAPNPTAGAINIDFAGVSQGAVIWSVEQATGTNTTGTHGSGAVAQSLTQAVSAVTANSISLTNAIGAGNATYGAFGISNASARTVGTGYTSLSSITVTGTAGALQEYRLDGQQTVNITWITSGGSGGIAIEIAAPAAGGIPNLIYAVQQAISRVANW